MRMNQKELKFLVDVGVGKTVEQWLQRGGYDINTVRDINPKMDDREILSMAVSEERMVITMDKDFGELVHNSGLPHAGVLLLRLDDAKADEKVRIVENILRRYSDRLLNKFCVYQHGRLRIRS